MWPILVDDRRFSVLVGDSLISGPDATVSSAIVEIPQVNEILRYRGLLRGVFRGSRSE